jgi:Galactose oxidase, central domain
VQSGDCMYLFGGADSETRTNDLYEFNISKDTLTLNSSKKRKSGRNLVTRKALNLLQGQGLKVLLTKIISTFLEDIQERVESISMTSANIRSQMTHGKFTVFNR